MSGSVVSHSLEVAAVHRGYDFLSGKYRERDQRFRLILNLRRLRSNEVWLLKPLTYMNASGESLRAFTDFYKVPTQQILVAHDEIDLPNGSVKIKWAGGHGGHNGLRSIFSHLDKNFWRLRLGVGHPGRKEDVIDYVLKKPSSQDRAAIDSAIDESLATLDDLLQGEMEAAMKNLHTKE